MTNEIHVSQKSITGSRTFVLENILEELVKAMGWKNDPNFKDTPKRVAKWLEVYQGLSKQEVEESIQRHLKAKFPTDNKGLIIQDPIKAFSMCPHHMLMIEYDVFVPSVDILMNLNQILFLFVFQVSYQLLALQYVMNQFPF